jgi:thioredoxin 1
MALPTWVWAILAFVVVRTVASYLAPQIPTVDTSNLPNEIVHIESLSTLEDLLASTTYVVVDFYADWCGPCKAIAPFYQKLAADHSIKGKLAFAKVNVDKVQEAARKWSVSAMPTFMFFKDGKQVAVNGNAVMRGADAKGLKAVAEKLSGLVGNGAVTE